MQIVVKKIEIFVKIKISFFHLTASYLGPW